MSKGRHCYKAGMSNTHNISVGVIGLRMAMVLTWRAWRRRIRRGRVCCSKLTEAYEVSNEKIRKERKQEEKGLSHSSKESEVLT